MLADIKKTIKFFTFIIMTNCLSFTVYGDPQTNRTQTSSIIDLSSLNLDASWIWIDKFERPPKNLKSSSTNNGLNLHDHEDHDRESKSPRGSRSLGLKHLKLDFTSRPNQHSYFSLQLRPDFNAPERQYSFNSVASGAYTKSQDVPIRFLNSYHFSLTPSPNLQVSLGVWEDLSKLRLAYTQIIDFGLHIPLPSNFAGGRINWLNYFQEQSYLSHLSFEVITYTSGNDRLEVYTEQKKSFDKATQAKQPFYGVAAITNLYPKSTVSEISLLAGYHQEKQSKLQINEFYAESSTQISTQLFSLNSLVATTLRYQHQIWKPTNKSSEELGSTHSWSISMTGHVSYNTRSMIQAGYFLGNQSSFNLNEFKRQTTVGHQIELGWQHKVYDNLHLRAALAQEERRIKLGSASFSAGFRNHERSQGMLRRFALELNYVIGS